MCVDKRKGLLKDMWVSSKVTAAEVTCFDKVQDNNIACSCTSEPEVTIKAIGCSEQAECKVTHAIVQEISFLDCSDNGTDGLDTHDISRL